MALRSESLLTDTYGVKEHCAQCLQVVYANGHQTPSGTTICGACYSALWGPDSTDSLR
jgi:hypothetical protein